MTASNLASALPDNAFVVTRTFHAPRTLMWKMWTEPRHMAEWWGPRGFKPAVAKMDLRPGGTYHYCLEGLEGASKGVNMWGKLSYREVVPPQKLVFTVTFSDEAGGVTRHPMSPTWPLEMLTILTFSEHEGRTTVNLRWTPLNATPEEQETFDTSHAGMQQGWSGSFDQLEAYLAKL